MTDPFYIQKIPNGLALLALTKIQFRTQINCQMTCKWAEALSKKINNKCNRLILSLTYSYGELKSQQENLAFSWRNPVPRSIPLPLARKYLEGSYLFYVFNFKFQNIPKTHTNLIALLKGLKIKGEYMAMDDNSIEAMKTIIKYCNFEKLSCNPGSIEAYHELIKALKGNVCRAVTLREMDVLKPSYDEIKYLGYVNYIFKNSVAFDLSPFLEELKQIDTSTGSNIDAIEFYGMNLAELTGAHFLFQKDIPDTRDDINQATVYGIESQSQYISIAVSTSTCTPKFKICLRIHKDKKTFFCQIINEALHGVKVRIDELVVKLITGGWADYASVCQSIHALAHPKKDQGKTA